MEKCGEANPAQENSQWAVRYKSASIRLMCRTFNISETYYRYQPKLSDENELIADWLLALTTAKKALGFGLCYLHLRNDKGFKWNHKRVIASNLIWSSTCGSNRARG